MSFNDSVSFGATLSVRPPVRTRRGLSRSFLMQLQCQIVFLFQLAVNNKFVLIEDSSGALEIRYYFHYLRRIGLSKADTRRSQIIYMQTVYFVHGKETD